MESELMRFICITNSAAVAGVDRRVDRLSDILAVHVLIGFDSVTVSTFFLDL